MLSGEERRRRLSPLPPPPPLPRPGLDDRRLTVGGSGFSVGEGRWGRAGWRGWKAAVEEEEVGKLRLLVAASLLKTGLDY